MKFTTCFDQESQPSRLLEHMLKHSEHRVIDGILTLHDPFFQRVKPGYTWLITYSLDYNSNARLDTRFNLELFPLHSPLLGESLLVSFPPLNNMLKFSGSSRLIRVQGFCVLLAHYPRRRGHMQTRVVFSRLHPPSTKDGSLPITQQVTVLLYKNCNRGKQSDTPLPLRGATKERWRFLALRRPNSLTDG